MKIQDVDGTTGIGLCICPDNPNDIFISDNRMVGTEEASHPPLTDNRTITIIGHFAIIQMPMEVAERIVRSYEASPGVTSLAEKWLHAYVSFNKTAGRYALSVGSRIMQQTEPGEVPVYGYNSFWEEPGLPTDRPSYSTAQYRLRQV